VELYKLGNDRQLMGGEGQKIGNVPPLL